MIVTSYRWIMPPNHTDVRSAPQRASYSQLSTMADCAKRYELSYVARVPRRPGVWFPAGSAVHASIQRYLTEVALPREGKAA